MTPSLSTARRGRRASLPKRRGLAGLISAMALAVTLAATEVHPRLLAACGA